MSEVLQEYRQVFTQQRLFNYGSILLSALGILATWLLIQMDVSVGWICALTFLAFYAINVMASRVRTNPLIRCTIENADAQLYSNLWIWSALASFVSIFCFAVACVMIWKLVPNIALDIKAFTALCCLNGGLMIAASVE